MSSEQLVDAAAVLATHAFAGLKQALEKHGMSLVRELELEPGQDYDSCGIVNAQSYEGPEDGLNPAYFSTVAQRISSYFAPEGSKKLVANYSVYKDPKDPKVKADLYFYPVFEGERAFVMRATRELAWRLKQAQIVIHPGDCSENDSPLQLVFDVRRNPLPQQSSIHAIYQQAADRIEELLAKAIHLSIRVTKWDDDAFQFVVRAEPVVWESKKRSFPLLLPIQANPFPVRAPLFVSISGIIGAGKTTLADKLGPALGLNVYHETVDENGYLGAFYRDPSRYGFVLQIKLLTDRLLQQQQIVWGRGGGVQDRTIYEDSVFCKMLFESGLMEPLEYRAYAALFSHVSMFMCKPDMIVHLDVDPEESFRRIKGRGRDCESRITLDYLRKLAAAYEEFLAEISKTIRIVRIDWNSRTPNLDATVAAIKREHEAMRSIKSLTIE